MKTNRIKMPVCPIEQAVVELTENDKVELILKMQDKNKQIKCDYFMPLGNWEDICYCAGCDKCPYGETCGRNWKFTKEKYVTMSDFYKGE